MSTKALSQGTSNCTKVSGLVLWVDNLLCCLCRQSTAAQLCFNEPQNDVGYMEP